ncbi:MAG: ATP-binding protein, partial [Gammaproteobacteria bacterium]|nr:ATP-binding protein [Gammaproteobacteria bacterium]
MTRRSTTLLDSLTKNEKLLQERLNFQTALFDTLPVPVFTKNTKGEYTAYNRAWLNFFGFDISGNADIAQPDIPISDTALQLEKEVDSALYRTKKSRNYELTMPFKDGTKKELLVSKASFTDANGNIAGLIGVMIDISDLKHAEAYARHVEFEKASADAASRAKSAFIANISHEVRTPLTAIIGFAETLLDYDQGMSDRIEGIKTIIRAGKHLHQIINEVLDLSKIESGKLEIENSEVGLFGLLEDVTALAKLQARNNGVEFGVNYEYPLPIHFSCDPTRTKQILYNIIGNAIKFTRGGEVNLSVRCDRNDQKILFSIKDTGIGISDEQMSKLFQPFIQADTSTTRKFGGTGLGLYLSRALAQKMGGDITVTSTFGKGSCFTISLATGALSNVFFTHKLITNTDAPHQIPPTNSITLVGSILVVDDQPDNRRLVELYLRKVGLQCVGAENGEDGVTMAQNVPFDIILMDVNMPVMDGLTATKILRQRNYNGVILALTANVAGEDIARCLNAGCNDVISKPIDRQEFLEKIREHLTPTQRTSENPAPMESSLVPDDPISAELIQFFVELLPHRLSDLDHAYDMADWPGIRDKAHALKGVGGGYGYPQI